MFITWGLVSPAVVRHRKKTTYLVFYLIKKCKGGEGRFLVVDKKFEGKHLIFFFSFRALKLTGLASFDLVIQVKIGGL